MFFCSLLSQLQELFSIFFFELTLNGNVNVKQTKEVLKNSSLLSQQQEWTVTSISKHKERHKWDFCWSIVASLLVYFSGQKKLSSKLQEACQTTLLRLPLTAIAQVHRILSPPSLSPRRLSFSQSPSSSCTWGTNDGSGSSVPLQQWVTLTYLPIMSP